MMNKFDGLARVGLAEVFRSHARYQRNYKELRTEIVKKYPSILEGHVEALNSNVQKNIVTEILESRPDLFYTDYWNNLVNGLLTKFLNAKEGHELNSIVLEQGRFLLLLAKIKDELDEDNSFDWPKFFSQFVSGVNGRYPPDELSELIEILSKKNPQSYIKYMHDRKTVSFKRRIRTKLYNGIISNGLLDKKLARRIRSDSSSAVSLRGVECLFNNLKIYPREKREDLILQFSDTRHRNVAISMARRTPDDLLPFLVGLKDPTALEIVEERMTKLAEKEEA